MGHESEGAVKELKGPPYSTNLGVLVSDPRGEAKDENGNGTAKLPRETIDKDTKVRIDVIIRNVVDSGHPCGGGPLLRPPIRSETFAITRCSNSAKGSGLAT